MDVLHFALQFEKDGEAFYRAAGAGLDDKNLSAILILLAEEEKKHYQFIKALGDGTPEHPQSDFLTDIANIFTRLREKGERFTESKTDVTGIFTRAMAIENESIAFYRSAQAQTGEPGARDLFSLLAGQEEAHYSLLSSLIEYYETPHLWMEQAEFNNLKDY
jgi:rubrerythrin